MIITNWLLNTPQLYKFDKKIDFDKIIKRIKK